MDDTRTVDIPPESESTEWLLRLQAWAHGGDALLLEAADELSKLRKDAERYRWLKRNPQWLGWEHDFRPDEVEREIDAAMSTDAPGAA